MQNSIKIDPLGFREYDARWLYPENINSEGIKLVGKGFGTQVINKIKNPRITIGHDYRSYSEEVKKNFIEGLISTGCHVEDIGLCLSPTIYFSQFDLYSDAVAMITASHNENGWTGIKMGIEKGLTHCFEEMEELKNLVINKKFKIGDRVGVIDNKGNEIFSDKIGLLIARNISKKHPNSKFIVDVKSTGLFAKDEVLKNNKCKTIYWKTGHSYIKRKVNEEKAIAGFEKSGHFFFNHPLGYGYDDGINSAIQVCHLLDSQNKKMKQLINDLPKTFQSPTMSPFCKDEEKYIVIDKLLSKFKSLKERKEKIDGIQIVDILTVNGIRFTLEDGSWGLIRASSNKPSLVVVTESPTSKMLEY